ncbi:MAG: biotin/lipoyl-binding protein, partial [Bacteroidales bacterium]|nr:biotin/lipoyl-binding protein [Candidatus Cryptobacteroides faecihippi]
MENQKKNYNLVIGIAALVLIILTIGIIGYIVSKPAPAAIQGAAEASEYRVSGKVPGRIEELYVKEGQMVSKGDTIARIDSPEVRAKLAQANAVRNAAS